MNKLFSSRLSRFSKPIDFIVPGFLSVHIPFLEPARLLLPVFSFPLAGLPLATNEVPAKDITDYFQLCVRVSKEKFVPTGKLRDFFSASLQFSKPLNYLIHSQPIQAHHSIPGVEHLCFHSAPVTIVMCLVGSPPVQEPGIDRAQFPNQPLLLFCTSLQAIFYFFADCKVFLQMQPDFITFSH